MALVLREEVNEGLGSLGEHGNDDDGHVVEVEGSHKQGQNHKEGNHVTNGSVRPEGTLSDFFITDLKLLFM